MAAVSSVPKSGNVDIDGVLSGYRWASGDLTYSFPTLSSQYGFSVPGFQSFNEAQKAATKAVFAHISSVADLTFTEAKGGSGTLRFAETSDAGTAYAYYPHSSEIGGDVFFNRTDYNTAPKGSYAFLTFLHEIGHALGLDHGQDGQAALPRNHDSLEYSVMTYRSYVGAPLSGYTVAEGSFPVTLMLADIAALQYMYGANYGTNAGDSVYRWSPSTGGLTINGAAQGQSTANKIFMTIWDGGGNDTYDFSAYSTHLKINLTPGEWSTTSSAQLADLGHGNSARGNIANAWLYKSNTASLIENAIGGTGNDLIVGNQAGNVLRGGAGNDSLKGLAGSDTIIGGSGTDICYFDFASTACTVTYDETAKAYLVRAGREIDVVSEVEFFAFTDRKMEAGVLIAGAPQLLSSSPSDNGKNVGESANIILTFSEDVQAGSGKIVIRRSDGTLFQSFDISAAAVTFSGNIVTIDPTGLFASKTGYYVEVTSGAIRDMDNLAFTGISGSSTLNFTTESVVRGTSRGEALQGSGSADRIYGSGGRDTVTSGGGRDYLDGGTGADKMSGGTGGDTYIVNNTGDRVIEKSGQGTDTVRASVNYTLPANVEKLVLTGSGNINGSGNSLANAITGNDGNNILKGKGGNDTIKGGAGNDRLRGDDGNDILTGGEGSDSFVFKLAPTRTNVDTITDFTPGTDTIVLGRSVFKVFAAGSLTDADFAFATDADAASARIIYDRATGSLFYDRDGAGSAADVKFAILTPGLAISAADFLIV